MKKKICIVGAGPAAWVAIRYFTQENRNYEVHVISPDDSELSISSRSAWVKEGIEGNSTYDLDKFNSLFIGQNVFPGLASSKTIGGFGNVWGASLDEEDDGSLMWDQSLNSAVFETNVKRSFSREVSIGKSQFELTIKPARLSLHQNLCTKQSLCILGCPTSAIWSPRSQIKALELKDQIKVTRGFIRKIDFNKSPIVYHEDGSSQSFDKVILAPGILGVARILFESDNEISRIEIEDSSTTFFAGIKIRKMIEEKWLSLHHSRLIISGNDFESHIQLYPQSNLLLKSAKRGRNKILQKIIELSWPLFKNILITGIIYLPAKNSESLSLTAEKSGGQVSKMITQAIPNENQERQIVTIFRILLKSILPIGFIPLRATFATPGVGTGFHSGNLRVVRGTQESISTKDYIREKSVEDVVLVLGSSELDSVDAGPITSRMMRQSYENIQQFMRDNS